MADDWLSIRAHDVIRHSLATFPDNPAMARATAVQALLEGGWGEARTNPNIIKRHNTFGQKIREGVRKSYSTDAEGYQDHRRLWYDTKPSVQTAALSGSVEQIINAELAVSYLGPHPPAAKVEKYRRDIRWLDQHIDRYWKEAAAGHPELTVAARVEQPPARSIAGSQPGEAYFDNATARRLRASGQNLYDENRKTYEQYHMDALERLETIYHELHDRGGSRTAPYKSIFAQDDAGGRHLDVAEVQRKMGLQVVDGLFGQDMRQRIEAGVKPPAARPPAHGR